MGEKYETLKDRVVGWATTRTEKKGGSVPMDLDGVEEVEEENWSEEVAAVFPMTKCYNGHMARECPQKGKGKGDMKGGGKGGMKGGFKGYDKGGGIKGGFKGDGKGGGFKGFEKGYWPKGGGKEVVTKERALNAEKLATKRRSAWCTWLGRRALKAKRRRRSAK